MPGSIEVTGIEELIKAFEKAPEKARKVASEALYEGAGVVADKVSQAVQGITTAKFKYARNGQKRKPSPEEKQILTQARHGVAKFKFDGSQINTSVGFQNSGYGKITWAHARTNNRTVYRIGKNGRAVQAKNGSGDRYKPVPLIANAINSGTSFMDKQPFLRKAFSTSNAAAKAAIENGIKQREDELLEGIE